MKRWWSILGCLLCCIVVEPSLSEINTQRAEFNFTLFCQGCHGPKGAGKPGNVPRIKNFMGNFLRVDGGREFLVQVPGSAYSALDDKALAELLNWMLVELSTRETPVNFRHYTANEVGKLRTSALTNVDSIRLNLIKSMQLKGIDIAENAQLHSQ